MSRTRKTYRARMSDGQIVEVTNAAGWDVYSFFRDAAGHWHEGLRGNSANSVRARSRTLFGTKPFEVVYMAEIMPAPMDEYFTKYPAGERIYIQQVFMPALGWVRAIPGGTYPGSLPSDKPFCVTGCRPTRSFCRLLANHFGVTALSVGNVSRSADFQMAELGLRLPRPRIAPGVPG